MSYLNAEKIEYLSGSLFLESEKTGRAYIDKIDIDRLLAPLFEVHGLSAPNGAVRYLGWERKSGANWFDSPESFTLAGHSLGHYMSAVSKLYESTADNEALTRIDYIISQLAFLQDKAKSGYIGGCNEDCFLRLFSGEVENWTDGYWVPWYNLHKIYKGLIDIYSVKKDKKALGVLIRFADWAYEGLKDLSDAQFEKMLKTEYGGMNEVFANLFEITNDEKYLDLAVRFTEKDLLDSLLKNEDRLEGLHANTQIPKVIGMAAIYRACPERYAEYRTAAENFFKIVTHKHSYAIGGNSVGEHFESPLKETLGIKTCESCNSYNMLRLTKYLYAFSHSANYFEYYERVLYNHILPQQEAKTGAKMYFVSLLPAHHKTYEKSYESWWCCTGTGMENPMKYRQAMFFEADCSLYINLYSPCRFRYNGLTFEMRTYYPYSDTVELSSIDGQGEAEFKFRVPEFAEGFEITSGSEKLSSAGKGYISVKRNWNKDDKITIKMSFSLKLYYPREVGRIVYTYGPLTLAARLGKLPESVNEYTENELIIDTTVTDEPIITAYGKELRNIPVASDSFAHFVIKKEYNNLNRNIELVPFGEIEHEFYSVYLKFSQNYS